MKKQILVLMMTLTAICLVGQAAVYAAGGIQSSAHDFRGKPGWPVNVSICQPCHTPHFANTNMPVLWNHQMSVATYTVYTSPFMKETAGEPAANSKLCLSCHDGTVALDNYGGVDNGTLVIASSANIGTDLSNDHPIGIKYGHNGPANCANCHFSGSAKQLKFYDGKVECGSCHDPHNKGEGDKMLRITNVRSELCLFCHGK